MFRASIDLGTNTCLLLMVNWDPSRKKIVEVIGDFSTIVRLGEGVDRARELQPGPMSRTLECLKKYRDQVLASGGDPVEVVCVATSQARDARNSDEFFSRVKLETGFQFRVVTGEEEAQLSFLGALLPGMKPEASAVLDIGGGSTELISMDGGKSVDIGSVRLTERFFKVSSDEPVRDEDFWACQEFIDQTLEQLKPIRNSIAGKVHLVGVAGTITTLAAWFLGLTQFDSKKIDSLTLTRGDVHRMVEELKWRSLNERRQLPGIEPLRADVILAGALVLWRSMEVLQFTECRVSSRGLRYGLITS